MTDIERDLRKTLRKHLEEQVNEPLFDKHGNEVKALHLTKVMDIVLNDRDVSYIKYKIAKEHY